MEKYNKTLIIIAPTSPPDICGVSDFAFNLALEYNLNNKYDKIHLGIDHKKTEQIQDGISVKNWRELFSKIVHSNSNFDIIINYTPRAYSKFSFPYIFIRSLKNILKRNENVKIFIFCHEVWNGSENLKIHHKVFDIFAKITIRMMAELSTGISTVTTDQKTKLESLLPHKKIVLLPIGANIFLSYNPIQKPLSRQDDVWVVFGLAHSRLTTVKYHIELIKRLYNSGVLKKIYSIGPCVGEISIQELACVENSVGKNILFQLGELTSHEISKILVQATGSFVAQSKDSISKSGSFTAMAAHALPVICDIPIDQISPPGIAIFRPDEITENPFLIKSNEAFLRTQLLYKWYIENKSWFAILNSVENWILNI